MNVRFTRRARASLRQIALYIAKDNPAQARSFSDLLETKAREITRSPLLYSTYPNWPDGRVRRRIVNDYLILFEIRSDHVVILDIRHGARDPNFEP